MVGHSTHVDGLEAVGDLEPEIVVLEPQEAIAVRGDVPVADLPGFFARAFHEAAEAAGVSGATIVGPPLGFYPEMPAETVVVEAGFPVAGAAETRGDAHRLVLPGGRAVRVIHRGPYETMERTYRELQSWMAQRGLEPTVGMWECYLSDPQTEPDPSTWRTMIVCPIA